MLLDTASLYFRAFYGVPESVTAPDGTPINAVRGLLDMIARLVTEFEPTRLVACWDDDWRPRWRVDLIPSYKEHRVAGRRADGPDVEVVPDALTAQIPVIRAVLEALGIPILGAAEHEADDVIGTLASTSRLPVDVVTGDRDLYQLIDDDRNVRVIYTGGGMSKLLVLTASVLVDKYGVRPEQYADFATMRGDASDGLPGVAGVGEKTATGLLSEYGDLAGILDAAADPESGVTKSVRAKLDAASDYLAVAPRVVAVVRDLALPSVDDAIVDPEGNTTELDALATEHGLGGSMDRVRPALAAAAH
jgi:5'-3' exonuclease